MGVHVLRHLKEELAWATDKWFQVISNIMLFKTVVPLRNIVCVAMWSVVTYSNCLVIYYQLKLQARSQGGFGRTALTNKSATIL